MVNFGVNYWHWILSVHIFQNPYNPQKKNFQRKHLAWLEVYLGCFLKKCSIKIKSWEISY